MRIPLLLAVALAACAPHPPPPAPTPEPAPATPAADAPPRPVFGGVQGSCGPETGCVDVCVVRDGRLEAVEFRGAVEGDSTYRQRYAAAFPTDSTYAGNAGWYRSLEPIPLLGDRYVMYGLVRVLGMTDVVPITTFRGVTVFAEPAENPRRPEVIYLPIRPGCEFQPYMRMGSK